MPNFFVIIKTGISLVGQFQSDKRVNPAIAANRWVVMLPDIHIDVYASSFQYISIIS